MLSKETVYANIDNILTIFADEYNISYSHPYTWGEEEWQKVWDEITKFHDAAGADEQYYFGSLTLDKNSNASSQDAWDVVDGTNQLITLAIFIKALYDKDTSNQGLGYLLYRKDIIKGISTVPKTPSINIQISAENAEIQHLLSEECGGKMNKKGRILQGYNYFQDLIDERIQRQEDPLTDISALAATLLTRSVILVTKQATHDKATEFIDTSQLKSPPVVAKQLFSIGIGKLPKGSERELIIAGRDLVDQGVYLRSILFISKPKHLLGYLWKGLRGLVSNNSKMAVESDNAN
ncbi:MAG: DUF262 domain-containing protein [Candidatus Portiera sp.]|nr:DUF262 domain-containing protein [Portiera sp.]